jgi:hypothetical protein
MAPSTVKLTCCPRIIAKDSEEEKSDEPGMVVIVCLPARKTSERTGVRHGENKKVVNHRKRTLSKDWLRKKYSHSSAQVYKGTCIDHICILCTRLGERTHAQQAVLTLPGHRNVARREGSE